MTSLTTTSTETLIVRKPRHGLAKYVDCIWYFEAAEGSSSQDRVLPHGEFELVISLSDRARAGEGESLIAGPQTRAIIVDQSGQSPMVGAHFSPGGAAALFGYPAHEFRDLDIPLRDVWPARVGELRERLFEVDSPDDALTLLESDLFCYAGNAPDRHPAIALAIAEFHSPSPRKLVRDLVGETGLSQRRFIELFRDQVGLTPKLYARIQRFQRTLRLMSDPAADWAGIAYACGYADQAHFVREFRDFAGLRPTDYLPRWPEHPNHVPLAE